MKKAQFKIYDTVIKDHSKEFDSWFAKGSKFYEYVTSMSQPEIWFIENTMAQINHEPDQEEILRKSLIYFIFLDFEDRPPMCNKWDSTGEVARYWTRPEKHMLPHKRAAWNLHQYSTGLLYYIFVSELAGFMFAALFLFKHFKEVLILKDNIFLLIQFVILAIVGWFIFITGREIYNRSSKEEA